MPEFHSLKIEEVFSRLYSSKDGLTYDEANKRIKKYGLNELPRAKPLSRITIFISQFKSPLIYILLFAGLVSFILRDWVDMGVIFAAVFINTIIGFIQENKANDTLNKLKELIKHKALVLRDGEKKEVDSAVLTQGDAIILKAGNRVPADARLFEVDNLLANESSLTGESIPAEKNIIINKEGVPIADRTNMVYASTVIVKGSGRAVVCAIGKDTEIGKISKMVREIEEEKTPLQLRLLKFSNILGIIISAIVILIVVIGSIQGRKLFDMFIMGVALAVSAIPEGLMVAITVILVIGMQKILKQKSLVRKLIAAETLGSTTVICADKTGTLTEGKMQLAHIIIGDKEYGISALNSKDDAKEEIFVNLALRAAIMSSDASIENPRDELEAWKIIGDPTEVALMLAAIQSGLNKDELLKNEPKIAELPFDNENKFMISLHKKRDGSFILYEKGAPEKLLDKSTSFCHLGKIYKMSDRERKKINMSLKDFTTRGLRVIGVATRDLQADEIKINPAPSRGTAVELQGVRERRGINDGIAGWQSLDKNLVFIGFIALKDPLRQEAKETIAICREAGIRPIIITGDHPLTARAIAAEVGMKAEDENILTGESLDKTTDEKLKILVKKVDIYARVSPHHKLRIVEALKSHGEVVAMTGDGLNDSPALKAADIGISLGTATDIAKESSDLVLLDNNFKTIVAAIEQGRIIFLNIRRVVTYLIAVSFTELILIIGTIILGLPLAILPIQILWINIIEHGLPAFSIAFEGSDKSVMKEKPIKKREPILNSEMKLIIFGAGLLRDVSFFALFIYFYRLGEDINYLRTVFLAILAFTSLLSIFSIRNLNRPIWRLNPFSNLYLLGSVLISFILLILAVYWRPLQGILSTVSLNFNSWVLIISAAIASTAMIEIVKLYSFFINRHTKI